VLRKQPLQQLQWRLNSGWADLDGSNQENGVCLPLLAVRRACEDDGAFFLVKATGQLLALHTSCGIYMFLQQAYRAPA